MGAIPRAASLARAFFAISSDPHAHLQEVPVELAGTLAILGFHPPHKWIHAETMPFNQFLARHQHETLNRFVLQSGKRHLGGSIWEETSKRRHLRHGMDIFSDNVLSPSQNMLALLELALAFFLNVTRELLTCRTSKSNLEKCEYKVSENN